jgi:uncharacterized membrane protein
MMMWMFFWIIGKIPATFWLIMAVVGVALFFAAGILGRLPPFKAYSFFIKPLSVIMAVVGIYMYGGASINDHYQKLIKEYEQKIAIAEEKSEAVNTVIEERIKYQTQVIKDNQIVYQDRIIEVATEVDGQCKLDPRVADILNGAAVYPITLSAPVADKKDPK